MSIQQAAVKAVMYNHSNSESSDDEAPPRKRVRPGAPKKEKKQPTPVTSVEKTPDVSTSLDSSPTPPKKEEDVAAAPAPEAPEAAEAAEKKAARRPRDPNGHKVIRVNEVYEACHKTRYLPLGDGVNTFCMMIKPRRVCAVNKNWCDVEVDEVVNGSSLLLGRHIYTIEGSDLLKMCHLHVMMDRALRGKELRSFDQWVASYYSRESKQGNLVGVEYNDHASIADDYIKRHSNDFVLGVAGRHRLCTFFQKRCVRDLKGVDRSTCAAPTPNPNVVFGKALQGKFEYQIESFILAIFYEEMEDENEDDMDDVPSEQGDGDVPMLGDADAPTLPM